MLSIINSYLIIKYDYGIVINPYVLIIQDLNQEHILMLSKTASYKQDNWDRVEELIHLQEAHGVEKPLP